MTDFNASDRDVTRAIRSWLHEDRHEDASRIAAAVLDRVEATPRRRASWWPARRFLDMNTFAKVFVAAAAVVAVAFVGINLLPRSGSGPGGSLPSPSPTVAPTASPQPTLARVPGSGPIEAGTYLMSDGKSSIGVTIPAGWDAAANGRDIRKHRGPAERSHRSRSTRRTSTCTRMRARARTGLRARDRRRTIWLPPSVPSRTRTSPNLPESRSADARECASTSPRRKRLDVAGLLLKAPSGSGPVPPATTTSHSAHRAQRRLCPSSRRRPAGSSSRRPSMTPRQPPTRPSSRPSSTRSSSSRAVGRPMQPGTGGASRPRQCPGVP